MLAALRQGSAFRGNFSAIRRAALPQVTIQRALGSVAEYNEKYAASIADPEKFWSGVGERLKWRSPYTKAINSDLEHGIVEFYSGGTLNVAENCIDRHLETKGDQAALIWEQDEPGKAQEITYNELHRNVCRLANMYKAHGVKKGDVVTLYMPMVPEAVYAMLACARIGAVHSVVFAGFSAEALAQRMSGSNSRFLVTANEGKRGGKSIGLKSITDKACDQLDGLVEKVFTHMRTNTSVPMVPGRDVVLRDEMDKMRPVCPAETMDAEDPLFLLYTSGSTGNPKGMEHTSGGYLTYAALTHQEVFDYQEGDVHGCLADIGWITGHSYIVYGPLANGATTVLFESLPTYPDPGRYWETIERLGINQLYTSPTALRLLMQSPDDWVNKYDLSSLKVLGSVGEPINPEVWKWYSQVVGKGNCPVVDTWWQTETGGCMITPLPHDTDAKPGAATRPFYGVQPVLLDADGTELLGNDVNGVLALKGATPGMARSILGDFTRYFETFWSVFPGYYFTGDGARRDEDGHIWITGRVDDVINVSGHRMGTAEVESSLVAHEAVAEAAVVGFPHQIKGEAIYSYVILKEGRSAEGIEAELTKLVRKDIGPFAAPDKIQVVPALPKTSSGKIMRRILRKIAAGEYNEMGDTSTLVDPSVVPVLITGRKALFVPLKPTSH
jgi:acetyl-CoA synthetase